MESMRDINRVMEREITKGSSPLKLDHIEFGVYSVSYTHLDVYKRQVYFGDRETQELCWDNESTVETVVLLGNQKTKPDSHIKLSVDMDEFNKVKNGEK